MPEVTMTCAATNHKCGELINNIKLIIVALHHSLITNSCTVWHWKCSTKCQVDTQSWHIL